MVSPSGSVAERVPERFAVVVVDASRFSEIFPAVGVLRRGALLTVAAALSRLLMPVEA